RRGVMPESNPFTASTRLNKGRGFITNLDRSILTPQGSYNLGMRIRLILLAVFCALFEASPLPAKDPKWIEVSSDHFVLFTDTNEMKGRRLVSDFENRIATFAQTFGKVPSRQLPIEIFLFNEEQDFLEALPHIQ